MMNNQQSREGQGGGDRRDRGYNEFGRIGALDDENTSFDGYDADAPEAGRRSHGRRNRPAGEQPGIRYPD
jgi:hypothetical protein